MSDQIDFFIPVAIYATARFAWIRFGRGHFQSWLSEAVLLVVAYVAFIVATIALVVALSGLGMY